MKIVGRFLQISCITGMLMSAVALFRLMRENAYIDYHAVGEVCVPLVLLFFLGFWLTKRKKHTSKKKQQNTNDEFSRTN